MTREAALDCLNGLKIYLKTNHIDQEALNMAIEALKADTVEVVRCKDCKHKYVSGNGTTQYYVCDFMDAQFDDEGYCHHGERSEGDNNG